MVYKFYRLENFLYRIKLIPLAIIVRALMRIIFSCDIPYKAVIGKGTTFPHLALGVVIHERAKIGSNCKILQGVTIGGRAGYNEVPIIGNNVLVGANSTIMGPIKIGDNSTIGAGSVVLHDVDEGDVVAGVPAKSIKKINRER